MPKTPTQQQQQLNPVKTTTSPNHHQHQHHQHRYTTKTQAQLLIPNSTASLLTTVTHKTNINARTTAAAAATTTGTATGNSPQTTPRRQRNNNSRPLTVPRNNDHHHHHHVQQSLETTSGFVTPTSYQQTQVHNRVVRNSNQKVRSKTPRSSNKRCHQQDLQVGLLSGGGGTPRARTISTLLPPRRMSSMSSTTCGGDNHDGVKQKEKQKQQQEVDDNNVVGGDRSRDRDRHLRGVVDEREDGVVSGDEERGDGIAGGAACEEPVSIRELHFSGAYTSHKSHWLKKALENLGGTWVRDGKITNSQLVSEEFEEKMGILYDLAMAKKHDAIDRLVTEELEEDAGKGSSFLSSPTIKKTRNKSKNANKPSSSLTQQNKNSGGGVASATTPVQENFPFAPHLSGAVKESMSESLLRIMMRGDEMMTTGMLKTKDRGDGLLNKKGGGGKQSNKKGSSNKNNKKQHQQKAGDEHSSSSNSFEKSLLTRRRSLVQCFVCDGKLVAGTKDKMLSVGGSFVNKFGESSRSRARRSQPPGSTQTQQRYFRATANLMGFLPHEVNIRYSKNSRQLIVSGSRSKRGTENARQVRETIEVPKDVDIFTSLVVLRTTRGSLIFEQVDDDDEEEEAPPEEGEEYFLKKQ